MATPAFFEQVPAIVLHDALAELLGAADDGLIEYRYLDAVRLAGHSCPTVAGAWLMTLEALARLYPGETPERGRIQVDLRGAADEGAVGVVANVIGLITGAAGGGGFGGIAGHHARRGLLAFGAAIAGEARFTRLDSGKSVEASFSAETVPAHPQLRARMQRALAAEAAPEERGAFASAWQERVARIFAAHRAGARLVRLED